MSETARIAFAISALALSAGYGLVLAKVSSSPRPMRNKAWTFGLPAVLGLGGMGLAAAVTGRLAVGVAFGVAIYAVMQVFIPVSRPFYERLFYLTPESQDRSGQVPRAVTAEQDRYLEFVHASPRYRLILWGAAVLTIVGGLRAITIIGDRLPVFILAGIIVSFFMGAAILALLGWLQATLRVEAARDGLSVRFGLNRGQLSPGEVERVAVVPFPGTYGGWSKTKRVFWVPSVPEGVEVITNDGRTWHISSRDPAGLAAAIQSISPGA